MSDQPSVNPFQQAPASEPSQASGQYSIPVSSVALPSKGLLYPMDHPLCNEEFVDIRCMTAREEDLLTSPALLKQGNMMTKLMEACLMNKTIDPDSLLVADRNALLIAIRISGYGANYTATVECPDCHEQFEHDFSLQGLPIKPLGAAPLMPNVNLFSCKLPISGYDVQFKLLTGGDQHEIDKIQERKKKLGSSVDNGVTLRLFHSIRSINGETDKQKLQQAINNMRAGDSRALRKQIISISPEVELKRFAICTKCGEESEVEVPLGLNFFWPDANT